MTFTNATAPWVITPVSQAHHITQAFELIHQLYQAEQPNVAFTLTPQALATAWLQPPVLGWAWLAWPVSAEQQAVGLLHLSQRLATYTGRVIMHLEDIVVAPPYRGQGLGRLLLERAKQEAHQRGADRLTLAVTAHNTQAQALYSRCGFVPGAGDPIGYAPWVYSVTKHNPG
jgi:ribosomal protein S18 acetylase RimI-like enzyme